MNNPLNLRSVYRNDNDRDRVAIAFNEIPRFDKKILIDDISEFIYIRCRIDKELTIVAQSYDLYLNNKTRMML
jgi:hypothetical protein